MNKVIFVLLLFTLNGCAHKTVHEYCVDSEVASKYRSYDQCYTEVSARGGPPSFGRALGTVLKAGGEGVTKANDQPDQKTNLHCTSDLTGGYNCN